MILVNMYFTLDVASVKYMFICLNGVALVEQTCSTNATPAAVYSTNATPFS